MKKYIAPEAAIVNLAAESMLALSVEIGEGGGVKDGVEVGSNIRFEEDWED